MSVKMWEATVEIPTYQVGEKDINPMFLEKRVYQGSTGKVYPHPVIDKIYDEKVLQSYLILFLENDYIQVQIMPEIGGRIYRAFDKTNNYDFVYYNQVIKPALVGLTGPWISGGIEFNWPQHHRPNTFGDVEYTMKEHDEGSKTVYVGEIDRMYGTKVTTGFTLYPDKSYIEIKSQLYNRTSEPQTFLWWANPAVEVHDETQSIFPPDVHAVFDHGKRDVSKFPIATGVYYKQDYSRGVDISRYKNIPVPTSYMAYHSDYDFVGGYDYAKGAGILHIADHHVSPGKKQWTWGNGDFGKAWDRNLTDENGPYIELMTGIYTDNQPDFTWLQPYEEKTFTQYFMPYKAVGQVKNANKDIVMGLDLEQGNATVKVYATSKIENLTVTLTGEHGTYLDRIVTVSPNNIFECVVPVNDEVDHHLVLRVTSSSGREVLSYRPARQEILRTPDPAKAIARPEELRDLESLYLAGMHLEQYRHATYEPEDYYLEGLKRSSSDIRLNNAYGKLLLKRANFKAAERYFRRAIETATRHSPNPYDSEPYFNLGKALKFQGRDHEAYDAFFKSTWSGAWQAAGYFELAQIAFKNGELTEAEELIEHSLTSQYRNYKARNLKTAILRKQGRLEEAESFAWETVTMDPLEATSRYELSLIYQAKGKKEKAQVLFHEMLSIIRRDEKNIISIAVDLMDCGNYQDAIEILKTAANSDPMIYYYMAYCYGQLGNSSASEYFKLASEADPRYCFPNSLYDFIVLEYAIAHQQKDAKALYYLGNLLYDKKMHEEAITLWEKSIELDGAYATAKRNLALAYVNKRKDTDQGLQLLEQAFYLNPSDARVYYELDQLYKKLGYPFDKRLKDMELHQELVNTRDDLYLEYVTLHNNMGEHQKALDLILTRNFHPWEGGEGKIPTQYITANIQIAKTLLTKDPHQAIKYLECAKKYPLNIGEGKLAGAQENNSNYYLGCGYELLGDQKKAKEYFELASIGLDEPTSAMFYNDQPPHMIFYQGLALVKLGKIEEAKAKFNKLVDYGEKHMFDEPSIDYFAVSLPDFLVFDDDLIVKNKVHCCYMMGLGYIGLGDHQKAKELLQTALDLDHNHQGAAIHMQLMQ